MTIVSRAMTNTASLKVIVRSTLQETSRTVAEPRAVRMIKTKQLVKRWAVSKAFSSPRRTLLVKNRQKELMRPTD